MNLKIPSNVSEIENAFANKDVMDTFGMTNRTDDSKKTTFYKGVVDHEKFSACIFASDDIVQTIQATSTSDDRTLYSDGTFNITPMGIFKQVLILFAAIYGSVSVSHRFSHFETNECF